MNEQELCKKRLLDLSRQADRKGIVLFSDFLNLNELNIYHQCVHGKSVAQVILRWLTQRDIVALPKSTHKERMEENLNIFDFRLSDSEMTTIAGLDTKTSMFFRHDTPEAVDRFVGYVKERAGRE